MIPLPRSFGEPRVQVSGMPRRKASEDRGMAKKAELVRTVPIDPKLKPAHDAVRAFIKRSTSSPEAARESLQSAGILDSKGRLAKRYRPGR
ncbi:MAG: hypothetical protein AMXMBFR7_49170 [Planctomycetota bacterium]